MVFKYLFKKILMIKKQNETNSIKFISKPLKNFWLKCNVKMFVCLQA